jgi:galactose-1-phosphate uridylyltransferase
MKNIFHIFLLIAFLGGIIAPACGFSWGGKFSVVEICTTQGIELRVVQDDTTPDTPRNQHASEQCEFCFSNTHITALNHDASQNLIFSAYTERLRFDLYETIYLSRIKNNLSARGPPIIPSII